MGLVAHLASGMAAVVQHIHSYGYTHNNIRANQFEIQGGGRAVLMDLVASSKHVRVRSMRVCGNRSDVRICGCAVRVTF